MKLISIFFIIIVINSLFCQNQDLSVESPYENFKPNSGIEVMDFVFPKSTVFPNSNISDTLNFKIPLKESISANVGSLSYFFYLNFQENSVVDFKEISMNLNQYEKFISVDIDNDGIDEIFANLLTPWAGGGFYTIYWKKMNGIFEFENSFWGKLEKLNHGNNVKSFIVSTYHGSDYTENIVREVSFPTCNISKEFLYSSPLSIPIQTEKMEKKRFKINVDDAKLRVWPESINTGYYWQRVQTESNGNVEAILQSSSEGFVHGEFSDSESKIWYLVSMTPDKKPIQHTLVDRYLSGAYIVGWLDKDSLVFIE